MKQLSRIFKIIGILMVGLLLLVGGVLYFLSDKLEAFAISEINKKLTVQVKVKSHNVTWFETFPNISIRFSGVEIPESTPLANKPFLEAQKVYLSFNIIDVLRGKYKISKISIADATARIYIKNDSTNNYSVFRKTGKNSSSSSLDLKKILLENSRVDFMDFSSSIHTDILADELEASGNFQEEKFVVTAAGNGKINRMKIGESDWLEEKYFDIEGGIDVNTSINSYTFDNTALKLGDASFIFAGNIQKPEKDWITNLTVEGKEADLSTLLAVLPGKYAGKVREYSSEGQFYFKGKIKGKASATLTPFIDFSFGIKNGTIKNSSFGGNLSQVNLTASLNNKNNIFSLSVDPFNVVLNKQRITGSLLLRDFNNLYIDAHIKGNPDLKDLEAFIGVEGLKLQGQSNIDLSFAGYVNDFKSTATLLNTRFSGSVSLINVKVERESNPFVFSGVNGAFNFNNLEISTPGLKGNIGSNAFNFTGNIRNLLPYIFNFSDKVNLSGRLSMGKLSLDEFLNKENKTTSNSNKSGAEEDFKFPKGIDLDLRTDIGLFLVNHLEANNLVSAFTLYDNTLRITSLSAKTMGGNISINGSIKNIPTGEFLARLSFDAKAVDVNKMFYQCGNFTQQTITDKNIYGTITTNVQMAAYLSSKLVIDMNRLYAYAKVVMENGQLKNFEPLEGLSKFASIEELNNVKFSRLENEVEIRDNMVIIPEMTVKNNILDMQIKGSHTFDNCMDYTIRLKVSDILASRYNWRKNRKQDEVEDHGKQGMIIYLTVKGTPGNLKFGITKVSLAPKLNLLSPAVKESVKQEKNELKQMLKDEFSRDPEKKQDKPKEEVVDWDE